MIKEVSLGITNSVIANKKVSTNKKNVSFGNNENEKANIQAHINKKKNIAKTSIILGAATGLLSLGAAIFSKKARANLLPHEYIEIPVLVGAATTMLSNYIGKYLYLNNKSSK